MDDKECSQSRDIWWRMNTKDIKTGIFTVVDIRVIEQINSKVRNNVTWNLVAEAMRRAVKVNLIRKAIEDEVNN